MRRQLARTPSVQGYALALRLRDKTLGAVSAWSDRRQLARFERTGAHRIARERLRPLLLPATIVFWRCRADQLPVPWSEVYERIEHGSPP